MMMLMKPGGEAQWGSRCSGGGENRKCAKKELEIEMVQIKTCATRKCAKKRCKKEVQKEAQIEMVHK